MCRLCAPLTRRGLLHGAIIMPLALPRRHGGVVEPVLRLAASRTRRVAVTLDACPGKFDPRVANALADNDIPATIFVTALWMKWNKEGLAFLKSRPDLFTLENHGALHLPPVLGEATIYGLPVAGSLNAIKTEVENGAAAIEAATGRRPIWYRGAAGLYSPEAIPFIQGLGFRIAGYSLNSDEGASLPAHITATRIAAARDGDVIEGHINQPHRASGAGIAAGLIALKSAGAQFVRLDETVAA